IIDMSVDLALSETLKTKEKQFYEMLRKKWSYLSRTHRFVVDFSNGAAVTLEKNFLQNYIGGSHIDMINYTPDGAFSSHHSDTQEHKYYEQLIDKVQENNAEFGLMWDGDADRIGIV
ncbi:hypothetical protein KKH82_00630, partial [Patescibacteria group bacterium]|nr:hypothetical protein [Patescibacteria group bacterium]